MPSMASVFNEYALKSQYDTSIYLQVNSPWLIIIFLISVSLNVLWVDWLSIFHCLFCGTIINFEWMYHFYVPILKVRIRAYCNV